MFHAASATNSVAGCRRCQCGIVSSGGRWCATFRQEHNTHLSEVPAFLTSSPRSAIFSGLCILTRDLQPILELNCINLMVQLPPGSVDVELLHDATRREARGQ